MRPGVLRDFLDGYESSAISFLVQGFTFGFEIPFQGIRQTRHCKNLKSVENREHILSDKIEIEIKANRVEGPFDQPPFSNLQTSPLGLVPKKDPGSFRVIHHLSHPTNFSVNDGIPPQLCSVQYQTVDNAIQIIQCLGPGTLMAKTDIKDAFRLIPIHPNSYDLLGFTIGDKYYFDKCLPMGLSYSCNLFEKFSSALQWILERKFDVQFCVHILDDFLFLGPRRSAACYNSLLSFYTLANEVNFPIKEEKTVYPTTLINFMGFELDSLQMEIRLPPDKLDKLRSELNRFKTKRKATLQELQSLIGLLNFACYVVPPGRTFMRRIIDLTLGLKHPRHYRRLNSDARADMAAWSLFLDQFNGKALFINNTVHTSTSLNLFTDASNSGFGGIFGTKWFSAAYSVEWLSYHISVREFLPIVITIELWHDHLSNRVVTFYSDNIAVVDIINKHSSRDPHLMTLMRRFMVNVLRYNIVFKAAHIKGLHNIPADLLSRLQISQFRERYPHMDRTPTPVPPDMVKL